MNMKTISRHVLIMQMLHHRVAPHRATSVEAKRNQNNQRIYFVTNSNLFSCFMIFLLFLKFLSYLIHQAVLSSHNFLENGYRRRHNSLRNSVSHVSSHFSFCRIKIQVWSSTMSQSTVPITKIRYNEILARMKCILWSNEMTLTWRNSLPHSKRGCRRKSITNIIHWRGPFRRRCRFRMQIKPWAIYSHRSMTSWMRALPLDIAN